jgi:hypothetical protein
LGPILITTSVVAAPAAAVPTVLGRIIVAGTVVVWRERVIIIAALLIFQHGRACLPPPTPTPTTAAGPTSKRIGPFELEFVAEESSDVREVATHCNAMPQINNGRQQTNIATGGSNYSATIPPTTTEETHR